MDRTQALSTIGSRLWQSVSQDAGLLKESSAFYATLIHVLMRIYVAADSARRPAPTPEEKRYNEQASAMVFFREGVGFTLGWGVLKAGENFLSKRVFDRLSGYEITKPGVLGPGKAIGLAVKSLLNPTKVKIPDIPTAITGQELWAKRAGAKAIPRVQNALIKIGGWANKQGWLEAKDRLPDLELRGYKFVRNNVPKLLTSPLAILWAGWWLERTTLLHGDQIINVLLGQDNAGNKLPLKDRVKNIGNALPALAGFETIHQPLPATMGTQPLSLNSAPPSRPVAPGPVPGPVAANLRVGVPIAALDTLSVSPPVKPVPSAVPSAPDVAMPPWVQTDSRLLHTPPTWMQPGPLVPTANLGRV